MDDVMIKQNMRPSYPGRSAAVARTRARAVAGRRRPLTIASLGVLAGALLIAAIFVVAPWFNLAPSAELTTSDIDAHRIGIIVGGDGATKCTRATFDNRTGKISTGPASCDSTMIDQAPQGTARLNELSNSFK
jgi:hypothetical protein